MAAISAQKRSLEVGSQRELMEICSMEFEADITGSFDETRGKLVVKVVTTVITAVSEVVASMLD